MTVNLFEILIERIATCSALRAFAIRDKDREDQIADYERKVADAKQQLMAWARSREIA